MKRGYPLITSVTAARCPRCREGRMFKHARYSLKFMEMNDSCPCCGQSFIIEPGFFLGAAFFSYFINAILLSVVALSFYYTGEKITVGAMIASILVVVFALLPFTLRLSKSIWIHIFIRYEGPCNMISYKYK
jgi:uncharacterized protein (DUF983 family)